MRQHNPCLLTETDSAVLRCAVRIRDHPFMKLSREILNQQATGNQEGAISLQNELQQAINESLQPSQSHSV